MTSGANCDAIRPFTSTIVTDPSGRTKNSMLKSDRSNPSAGISRAATSAIARLHLAGPRALGYSNRRKLIPFGCMTASVTPTGVIRPPHMSPSNVTSTPSSSSSATSVLKRAPLERAGRTP